MPPTPSRKDLKKSTFRKLVHPKDSRTFLCTTIWSTSPFLVGEWWVGHCGAEISNAFICSKYSSFMSERLEITLFENGCLTFKSPASSELCLKFKRSTICLIPGVAWWLINVECRAALSYYQSVCFYSNKRRQVCVVAGDAFSYYNNSSAFSSWKAVSTMKVLIWNTEPLMRFETCLWKEGHIYM
jgi:hypothetical protein